MPVVHCKRERYDVYIGCGGLWGNPFRIGRDGNRGEVIAKYKRWLWREIDAGRVDLEELAALAGKVLGCWCAPQPCHGDVLAAAAEWAQGELGA